MINHSVSIFLAYNITCLYRKETIIVELGWKPNCNLNFNVWLGQRSFIGDRWIGIIRRNLRPIFCYQRDVQTFLHYLSAMSKLKSLNQLVKSNPVSTSQVIEEAILSNRCSTIRHPRFLHSVANSSRNSVAALSAKEQSRAGDVKNDFVYILWKRCLLFLIWFLRNILQERFP